MRQRLALIGNQKLENVEFLRRQVHFLARTVNCRLSKIQSKVLRNKGGSVSPGEYRLNAARFAPAVLRCQRA